MAGEPRDGQERFYFTPELLANSPSRKCGMDADQELQYRQRAANLIQDMGQRLHVSQLCINTAIVYMHRFYAFHSFTHFHRNSIAQAALFLAAKVEEQPRKLEHVIKVAHLCLNAEPPDPAKEGYQDQAQDLVFNENVLLQTLGFEVAIDHPHTHVVKTCGLVKASKELAQTSYFMASNSLHLTTMCLQYKPTVVACFCIHLACKWSRWEIPQSTEGKHWFQYVDKSVTETLLKQLTDEFLHIFDRCPTRLKRLKNLNNSIAASNNERDDGSTASSSSSHHKSGHHSSVPHHQQKLASSMDHKSSRSSSSSSSSQMPRASKMDRPSSSSHNYMQGLPNSSGINSDSNKMMPPGMAHNMRPPSQSSSANIRDSQQQPPFVKQRTSSSGLPQMPSKERQQHMNNNGSMPPNMAKHEKLTKMHPATIGVSGQNPTDNLMRKSQQSSSTGGSNKHLPPVSSNYNHQKHSSGSRMPPHMKQPSQQVPQQHSSKSQAIQQQLPPQPSAAQSFALLDDSIITSEPLKVSPTELKPKSIFSPDYTPSNTAPILAPQLNAPSVAPHPSRIGGNGSMKNINNNNNGSNMYNKKQQQPPQLLLDNHVHGHHLDFLKQEKISPEPPQQLLASTPVKSDSKKRPIDEDLMRDTKMRRLEARFEGLPAQENPIDAPDPLTFQDLKHKMVSSMVPDIKAVGGGVKNTIIPDTLNPRALVPPKMEREEAKLLVPPEKKLLTPIVNGGSDADVISSLLKESITLLAPLRNPTTVIETPAVPNLMSAGENVDSHHRKSEKKKKKDKHKHKERSKDREEKKEKKHKKDKDRHRDRSREREGSGSNHHQYHANNSTNHHPSLQSQSQPTEPQPHSTGSLKIKIPKEKITRLQDPPAPLKIKIPKQKIGDYL